MCRDLTSAPVLSSLSLSAITYCNHEIFYPFAKYLMELQDVGLRNMKVRDCLIYCLKRKERVLEIIIGSKLVRTDL
jgi:hypothetical protein